MHVGDMEKTVLRFSPAPDDRKCDMTIGTDEVPTVTQTRGCTRPGVLYDLPRGDFDSHYPDLLTSPPRISHGQRITTLGYILRAMVSFRKILECGLRV